jgi:thiol-disulfide isomerase/thioredoxin
MEQHSASLQDIGSNGKPTLIDFWAPWCANCRVFAPTLRAIENEYQDRVNFIVVNGDDSANYNLIQLFGVDAIPHIALLDSEGDVETALIGPISRRVLRADIDALLSQQQERGMSGINNCGGGSAAMDEGKLLIVGEGGDSAAAAATTTAGRGGEEGKAGAATTTSTIAMCHDELPYKMYDAFVYRSEESRRISFR